MLNSAVFWGKPVVLGSVHGNTSELMLVHRFLGGSTFYMLLTIYYKD